jgi:hypothetical protein
VPCRERKIKCIGGEEDEVPCENCVEKGISCIKADGTVNTSGKWEIAGNKLIITFKSGNVETFILPIKNNSMSGSNSKGMAFTLTKVVAK